MVKRFPTDEQGRTRLYRVWDNMRTRCTCPSKGKDYELYYGGKGIRVCESWMASFAAFQEWAMEHGYDDYKVLDRIDSNGDYCPQNCRFVTITENNRNRSCTIRITALGVTQPLSAWAEFMGVPYGRLYNRYIAGLTGEEILFLPFRYRKRDRNKSA